MSMDTFKPTNEVAKGIFSTNLNGIFYIAHSTFKDDRGFFSEVVRFPELEAITGQPFVVKQVNHARSDKNVARGIHTEDWNKYVTITQGVCFSAVADVRPESPTFGKVETFVLGHGENALDGSLYLPAKIGNSLCVLEGPVDYLYFVDRLYADRDKAGDLAISLFDQDLNIQWPIPKEQMIISERDMKAVTLRERFREKFM